MKIVRITPYLNPDFAYIQSTDFTTEFTDALIDGEELDNVDFQKIKIKNFLKEFPDLMGTGSSELFASERLKEFLEDKVQNQKLKFIKGKLKSKNYYLINIIGLRNCMDLEKSIFTTYKKINLPHKITKLIVKEEKLNPFDLFRITEKPIHVFITEPLKKSILHQGFTGFEFLESMDLTYG